MGFAAQVVLKTWGFSRPAPRNEIANGMVLRCASRESSGLMGRPELQVQRRFAEDSLKTKTISFFVTMIAIACSSLLVAFAQAQGAPQAAKTPPPVMIGPTPPSPEAQRLATLISTTATAKCGGKDADAAPDCRMKALWELTRCPPQDAPASKDAAAPSQPCVAGGPGFEFDVASIKPHKDDGNGGMMVGGSPDGWRSINGTMQNTVLNAYSTGLQMEINGAPGWMNDLHYDIEAKYTPEVMDALKKLTPEDRQFVRRYVMQQLLKERTNLAVHVETKEVPAYDLAIGKNGSKLKEADPNSKENGSMNMHQEQGKTVITAKGMQLTNLARNLSQFAGRPVFDKTGLTGIYDITLEFAHEQNLSASAPDGGASGTGPAMPTDPSGPSIMAALDEQLGLRLVPSRGPKMVVVIEHIDKPDSN
jgi:uncharacterized protein (TIGR03435 family)